MLVILTKAKNRALDQKATVDWQTVDRDWQQYFDKAGSDWRERFIPLMQGIIVEQGNDWNLQMGMEFDVRNLFAEKWFDDYTMKFASSTAESTREGMTGLLKQAMEEGWGIPNMQNNLGQMFDQWMYGNQSPGDFEWLSQRMPAYRLEMIARTETIRASNRGSNQLFAAWGVTEKEWLTTKDDRLCDWCAAMDGKIISVGGNFFDQGSQFNVQVGDVMRSLKLDYEDVSAPPLHPDCRCTILPVMGDVTREYGDRGRAPVGPDITTQELMELVFDKTGYAEGLYDVDEMMQLVNDTLDRIVQETGLDRKTAREIMRAWEVTSADGNPRSLLLQMMASETYDIPLNDWIASRIEDNVLGWGWVEDLQDTAGRLIDSTYKRTQEVLAQAGFGPDDVIRLRRGVRKPLEISGDWNLGDTLDIFGNPLESWTIDLDTARTFAYKKKPGHRGAILEMDVPVRSILSVPGEGISSVPEYEFVRFGWGGTARIVEIAF